MEQDGLPGFKELLTETLFTITPSSDTNCNALPKIDAGELRPKRDARQTPGSKPARATAS
jgi:hypothetical protein